MVNSFVLRQKVCIFISGHKKLSQPKTDIRFDYEFSRKLLSIITIKILFKFLPSGSPAIIGWQKPLILTNGRVKYIFFFQIAAFTAFRASVTTFVLVTALRPRPSTALIPGPLKILKLVYKLLKIF